MKATKPPGGKKGNAMEAGIIQMVPPVIFIRRKKTDLVGGFLAKIARRVFAKKGMNLGTKNAPYSRSKKVYMK